MISTEKRKYKNTRSRKPYLESCLHEEKRSKRSSDISQSLQPTIWNPKNVSIWDEGFNSEWQQLMIKKCWYHTHEPPACRYEIEKSSKHPSNAQQTVCVNREQQVISSALKNWTARTTPLPGELQGTLKTRTWPRGVWGSTKTFNNCWRARIREWGL